MVEIIYDTHLSEPGPWLLPEPALLSLDEIVNAEWAHLQRRRDELVEQQVKEAIESHQKRYPREELTEKVLSELRALETNLVGKESRKLKILCQGGKSVSVTTFAEALRSHETVGEKAEGFVLHLECADVRADLELKKYSGGVELTVRPVEVREARELFVSLRRWTLEFRPPAWQRIWRSIVGFHWVIWLFVLWISAQAVSSMPDVTRRAAIARGHQLLSGGLSNQEVRPALETLLAIAVAEDAKNTTIPPWFKVMFFGGLLISLLLSFAPRTAIAVGRGEKSVRFWRWWAQLVGLTLPIFLFGTFVWPYIEEIIRSIF